MNQTIQQELEAKRDTLCQLLNLKPASLIDSQTKLSASNRSTPANAPPLINYLINASSKANNSNSNSSSNNNNNNHGNNNNSTSPTPTSIIQSLLNNSSSKSKISSELQHNHNHHHFQTVNQNGLVDKQERIVTPVKHVETMMTMLNGHQGNNNNNNSSSSSNNSSSTTRRQQNGVCKVPISYGNNASYKDHQSVNSTNGQHKKQAMSNKLINNNINNNNNAANTAAASANTTAKATGNTTTKSRNKTNHKSSTSSSSSISTSTDKDSTCAMKLLVSLVNGTSSSTSSSSPSSSSTKPPAIESAEHPVELRNLESWHDEDEGPVDDSCYGELVDPSNSNGWSADEMFKYNEKMHKITSSYNEKTLSDNYTTPLRKINSRTTMLRVTQLAKEIEDRVIAEGRITPESSDDDELFESERMQRIQLKQKKQLDQLKNLQRQQQQQQHRFSMMNNVSMSKTIQSSSQYSNSTETPATASLSSSPTLNDTIIKPVTSSSRNILRTCLI